MQFRLVVAAGLAALTLSQGAIATAKPAPPRELLALRAAFAQALAKGDKTAVAGLTHFPLANDVYQQPKTLSPKAFLAKFDFFGGAEFAKCLETQPLESAAADRTRLGAWLTDCNGNIFYFSPFGDKWLFSGYENANE